MQKNIAVYCFVYARHGAELMGWKSPVEGSPVIAGIVAALTVNH